MLSKGLKKTIVLIFISLLVTSCSAQKENLVEIEPAYINNQILLRVAGFLNTFQTSDSIFLELKYNTTEEVVFPNNYNLRIFYRNNNEWIEISEEPTQRFPEGDIVFSPSAQMPIVESVVVHPKLPSLLDSYLLRIYVIGNLKNDLGVKKVAAFTEIKLNP